MQRQHLRKGWTTGACATAATAAAYRALLSGRFEPSVSIALPGGQTPVFPLLHTELSENSATASVIKDAGDDPDVTHGAEIAVTVEVGPPDEGMVFKAGPGVGTVTRPGLPINVGEAAITPAPRKMMENEIRSLAEEFSASADVTVTVSVINGEELARKTMNSRLGIIGGLSILGTTGVVIPYSCSAWIHAIHRGVDVALAAGVSHIAGTTGRTSEDAVRAMHGLSEIQCIEMGDFAGALLKYLRKNPVKKLTIGGGFAKMSKLATGHMDLHSSRSSVDIGALTAMLGELGAAPELVKTSLLAKTAGEILDTARKHHLPIGNMVAKRARETVLATLSGGIEVDVAVFDRGGEMVGHA